MTRRVELVRRVPVGELGELYHQERDVRVRERLHAVLLLYQGYEEKVVAEILRRGCATVRRWKDAWNRGGIEALKPDFKGGYAPRISSSKWDEILEEVKGKAMTLRDVQVYVNTKYGAGYAYTSVWYWVRGKKKAPYGKPYPRDARRPVDAEMVLKKLGEALRGG